MGLPGLPSRFIFAQTIFDRLGETTNKIFEQIAFDPF